MTTALKSPVSTSQLEVVEMEGILVFRDAETGGYWLRMDELEKLARKHQCQLSSVTTGEHSISHQGRLCPEDGAELREFEFETHSGIKLDICPKCRGIWLDKGELDRVVAYLEDHYFACDSEEPESLSLMARLKLFLYSLTNNPPLY